MSKEVNDSNPFEEIIKWISVEEDLPLHYHPVLVLETFPRGPIGGAAIHPEPETSKAWIEHTRTGMAWVKGYIGTNKRIIASNVTFWAELPKGPVWTKEDSDKAMENARKFLNMIDLSRAAEAI